MKLNAMETRYRLQSYSKSTVEMIFEILSMSKEAVLAMIDITTDSTLNEEQVVEKLKELIKSQSK